MKKKADVNKFEISSFGKTLTPAQRLNKWEKRYGRPRDAKEMEEVLSGKIYTGPMLPFSKLFPGLG